MVKKVMQEEIKKVKKVLGEMGLLEGIEELDDFMTHVFTKMAGAVLELVESGNEYELLVRHFIGAVEMMVFLTLLKGMFQADEFDVILRELEIAIKSAITTAQVSGVWAEFREDVKKRVDKIYEDVYNMIHGSEPENVG